MEADNLFRVPGPHQHPNSPSRRHRWGITRRHMRRADMARSTLLAGALPPSLRDLRPALTVLDLYTNGIAAVPTEIAPLTGLQDRTLGQGGSLALNLNGLTGFPMGTPHHVPDLRPVALLRLVQERGLLRERGRLQLCQSRSWHLRLHLCLPLTNAVHRHGTPGVVRRVTSSPASAAKTLPQTKRSW